MKKILTIYCLLFSALSLYAGTGPPSSGNYGATSKDLIEQSGVKGGLVVCIGAENPEFVAGLRADEKYLVHCLDPDQKKVDTARKHIQEKGLYGKVSVVTFGGKHLPYADNLVNLLIVHSPLSIVHSPEVERVLAPRGVAIIRKQGNDKLISNFKFQISNFGNGFVKITKPVPPDIDEWTHYLHGADGNAVAQDTVVGMPRRVQWQAYPRWGRSHEELNSMTACTSSKGRIFYIEDHGLLADIGYRANWNLVARDAFNGLLLWKRSINTWTDHLRHFRSGPLHLPRRLVSVGDPSDEHGAGEVYVTLGLEQAVSVLDAATGKTLRQYKGTEHTEEIIIDGSVVYLVVGTSEKVRQGTGLFERNEPEAVDFRYIVAFDRASGTQLWKFDTPQGEYLMPLSLAVREGKALVLSTKALICINAANGMPIWRAPHETPDKRMAYSGPTLVVHEDVVLVADRVANDGASKSGEKIEVSPAEAFVRWDVHGWEDPGMVRKAGAAVTSYDLTSGKELWSCSAEEGYNSPVDVFVARNLVWIRAKGFSGRDLKTGEITKRLQSSGRRVGMAHPRCHRYKATEKYLLTSRAGIEVIDWDKGWLGNNSWVRGTCQYGIMPANGLLYAPPNACACFNSVKLQGFVAMAPAPAKQAQKSEVRSQDSERLIKGEVYGEHRTSNIEHPTLNEGDWLTYRSDVQRSGAVATKIGLELKKLWTADLGGKLTQSVSVGDKVFVASVDRHTVYALDSDNGKELWSYIAGGRIDSSPTIWKGLLLFGCADGWVYCLQASDGELVWRYRAAPEERLISSFGQLESAWPIHGAVLVQNEVACFAAGRNTYADGGLILSGVKIATGEKVFETSLCDIDPVTDAQTSWEAGFNMGGSVNDVLTGNGEDVYLKHLCFDKNGKRKLVTKSHLFTPGGFIGEEWFIRNFWLYGTSIQAGFFRWPSGANGSSATTRTEPVTGRILCFDDKTIFSYGRKSIGGGAKGHRSNHYHLAAFAKGPVQEQDFTPREKASDSKKKSSEAKKKSSVRVKNVRPSLVWAHESTPMVRAMVLAGDKLIIAGHPDPGEKVGKDDVMFKDETTAFEAFTGKKGSVLQVRSAKDGKTLLEYKIDAMPVFDGMSAANGKLFVSLRNGEVVCYE
ncbi:PQQ-binding-like beta-propeller repeat protein [Verrucomicrobiota bacterium]